MKSILSSILSLIVSSSSKLPYVSHYSYDFQHGWLNIIVSKYKSQKTCGDIGISNNELQYKLFCGKENGKGRIPLSKIKFKYEKGIFSAQSIISGKIFFSVKCTQEQYRYIEKYIKK